MNKHFRAALLIAVLTLSLLTGCAVHAVGDPHVNPAAQDRIHTPSQTQPQTPLIPPASTGPEQVLTAEEAQAIALADAGFPAEQVRRLRVEPELRDRIPHFDVEFEEGRWEYEYEIHAETGAILSLEKDD